MTARVPEGAHVVGFQTELYPFTTAQPGTTDKRINTPSGDTDPNPYRRQLQQKHRQADDHPVMIEGSDPSSEEADQAVEKWGRYLESESRIPPEGQDSLRRLLQIRLSGDLRERVLGLLNPRGAAVVELSDKDFSERYAVTTADNYERPAGEWDQMAVFDAAHGFYVHAQVLPIRGKVNRSG